MKTPRPILASLVLMSYLLLSTTISQMDAENQKQSHTKQKFRSTTKERMLFQSTTNTSIHSRFMKIFKETSAILSSQKARSIKLKLTLENIFNKYPVFALQDVKSFPLLD
jgi:flagellar basal body L-ring protein FlgH